MPLESPQRKTQASSTPACVGQLFKQTTKVIFNLNPHIWKGINGKVGYSFLHKSGYKVGLLHRIIFLRGRRYDRLKIIIKPAKLSQPQVVVGKRTGSQAAIDEAMPYITH